MAVALVATVFCTVPASAKNGDSNYSSYNEPENSGDYAYWNGSKVVRSSSTSKKEVKWMQAALNNCIKNEGLKADYIDVDGSFGPATKKATEKFQKAAKLTVDGSFGPATIKKMKSVLGDGKKNSLTASKEQATASNEQTTPSIEQTNENGVVYTYITMSVNTSSMENWINSMKDNEKYACNSKKGVIVEAKVTQTKNVTWKVARAAIYQGPGITGTVDVKYKVPSEVKYKLHTHTKNKGFGNSWYYANGCIISIYTCNCGYRKELMAWEIPFPDTSDAQTTQKVIQGLPKIN